MQGDQLQMYEADLFRIQLNGEFLWWLLNDKTAGNYWTKLAAVKYLHSWLQVNRQVACKNPIRYAEHEVWFHTQSNTVW